MTEKEVTDSFIYNRWYNKKEKTTNETDEYDLSIEFMNMVRCGFDEIFKPKNTDEFVIPYQIFYFYCVNKDGYLKLFRKITGPIDNLSVKSLLTEIKECCIEFNLKLVALGSEKWSIKKMEEFLGDSLKYELNDKGEILLFY